VIAVEQAMTPALKKLTSGRLLNRMVEVNASIEASNIAASPPNINMVRKIKVSETETCPLARGI
jgi:hypothetical protein